MDTRPDSGSVSTDETSLKSGSEFVDLDQLSKIFSDITETAQNHSLITASEPIKQSLSNIETSKHSHVSGKPIRYNREHINMLAKKLNLINDSYKDVKVMLPLKENFRLITHDDNPSIRLDNESFIAMEKKNQQINKDEGNNEQMHLSASKSSLKSCMKQDIRDSDNKYTKTFIDDIGLVSFKPVVSFDTVPLGNLSAANIENNFIAPEDYYTEDEWYDNEIDEPYQDTYVGYKGHTTNSNQPSSSSFQNVASPGANLVKGLQKLKILEGYSTTPYINNSALIINKKHPLFDQYENDVKRKKSTIFKSRKYRLKSIQPQHVAIDKRFRHGTKAASIDSTDIRARTLRKINKEIGWNNQGRCLLVHISGRRHSWVALDYAVTKIANNGDTLVISCNLPKENSTERMLRRKDRVNRKILLKKMATRLETDDESASDSDVSSDDSDDEAYDRNETHWKNGYTYNEVEETLDDILKYIHLILPVDKIIKLTCEITVDSTKDSLINAYNCYLPKLVLTTSKKWQHDEKLGDEKSNLLADVITCNLPVPVLAVSVKKSDRFENYIKQRLKLTTDLKIPVEEKQKRLSQLNKDLLTIRRPRLPFMMIFNDKEAHLETHKKINTELHLQEFTAKNVTNSDVSASEYLSSILETYKKNLDNGLEFLDEKYPAYTDNKKSIEITDLIAEQSAKYNENFNKIQSKTNVDEKLDGLKNILSQGEYFRNNVASSTTLSSMSTSVMPNSQSFMSSTKPSNALNISSKPPAKRTVKLQPSKSPRDTIYPVKNSNGVRRYKTSNPEDSLKDNSNNELKRTLTSTSQKSNEKKKSSKFSFKGLFKRS